jgi:hypothetical protein
MATVTVEVTGSAPASTVWRRYLHPELWTGWAPHLTHVSATSRSIAPGVGGTVTAFGVVPARFEILHVNLADRSWSWVVRVGPVRLALHHDVIACHGDDGAPGTLARIRMEGPWPVLVAYRPLMRWAMRRLVSGETQREESR